MIKERIKLVPANIKQGGLTCAPIPTLRDPRLQKVLNPTLYTLGLVGGWEECREANVFMAIEQTRLIGCNTTQTLRNRWKTRLK